MKPKTAVAAVSLSLVIFSGDPICAASAAEAAADDGKTLSTGQHRLRGAAANALSAHAQAIAAAGASDSPTAGSASCPDGAVAPQDVRKMIEDEALRQSVDAKLALVIGAQESNFGAKINSSATAASGAKGVMQLMPETAIRYGVADRCDAAANVRGGISFIKDLSGQFGGNVFLILAAYNAGERRVYAARGVPAISETVRYVAAAANAYYDFPNVLNSAHRDTAGGAPEVALDRGEPQAEFLGPKWIGGSVLYVEQEK